MPANIDEDNCSADFADGVLTITLPKIEEKNRGRKISLGSGKSRENESENTLIEGRDMNSETRDNEKAREMA